MKHALNYLSGFGRSMTCLMPRPAAAVRPDFRQLDLLRAATMPEADAARTDAALAVQFFRARPAGASFLTASEAQEAVADYEKSRPFSCRALLDEAARVCARGLPVYASMAPALVDLDWSALPMDARNDRLYRLRPHRFGFLPRLAMASCLGASCLPALHSALARWLHQVETAGLVQDAYFSNLVVIYRLVAVSWAAPFLAAKAAQGDEIAAKVCLQLFRIVAADCHHLLPQLGQSIGNNHLLADRFAAWFLAACYPELLPTSEGSEQVERAWLAEFARQFQEDGTNFEQSLHYHGIGCELALAYIVVALRRGASPDGEALVRIGRALRFQAALAAPNGAGFSLGDGTNDSLLPLNAGGSPGGGGWCICYRRLFEPAFPATADTAAGAEGAYWLLAALRSTDLPLPLPRPLEPLDQMAAFPQGGYVAFRDERRGDRLLFRTGPAPGSAVHPGHAMSDLLSVYWVVQGRYVLEPTGTYTYAAFAPHADGGPESPRTYFRSPAAHNGPVLQGHDPLGAAVGRFRSTDAGARATTRWRSLEDVADWAEGRLYEAGGLNGWRRGVLRIAGRPMLVYDRPPDLYLDAEAACHWQLAPEAAVALRARRQATADLGSFSAYFCASRGVVAIDCVTGSQSPPGGWLSRHYGQLEAAPQLICRLEPGVRALAFAIDVVQGDQLPEVEAEAAGEGMVVSITHPSGDVAAVFGRFSGPVPGRALDLAFEGEVLWLEFSGDRCRWIGALGMQSLTSAGLGIALSAAAPQRTAGGWRRLAGNNKAGGLCGLWAARDQGPFVPVRCESGGDRRK